MLLGAANVVLFHPTVHALGARWCKTRSYTNVVCCSLKVPPSKLDPGVWYPRVISPWGAFWEVCQTQPLAGKHVGKVACGARGAYSPLFSCGVQGALGLHH